MWFLTVTALIIGCTGLEEDNYCQTNPLDLCGPNVLFLIPRNEEDFEEKCPAKLQQLRCMQEQAIKCESDELRLMTAYLEVMEDICREGSSLHEAIAKNIGCIKESRQRECSGNEKREVDRAYRNFLNITDHRHLTNEQSSKFNCMRSVHHVICIADTASHCGSTVKEGIIEVARRLHFLELLGDCPGNVREEIIKDIPGIEISTAQKVLLEEILLEI